MKLENMSRRATWLVSTSACLIFWAVIIMLVSVSFAHADEGENHDMLCLQYQKLATLTKKQADEGFPLDMHLASIQAAKRYDLIWIVKEVHRSDMKEFTPSQTGFIIWQACNSYNYPGAESDD